MNYNKVIIAGRLTRDLELRYTAGGTAVCDVGLAINEKRKVGDQLVDKVIFVDVTLWGRTAELAAKFLTKGSSVLIEGKLDLEEWADKDTGKPRSKMKVVGWQVQFGDGPGGRGGDRPPASRGSQQQQPPRSADQRPASDVGGQDVEQLPDHDIPI